MLHNLCKMTVAFDYGKIRVSQQTFGLGTVVVLVTKLCRWPNIGGCWQKSQFRHQQILSPTSPTNIDVVPLLSKPIRAEYLVPRKWWTEEYIRNALFRKMVQNTHSALFQLTFMTLQLRIYITGHISGF